MQANRYLIDKLLDSQGKSKHFLAVRKDDKKKVVLKYLQQACELDNYGKEFEILQKLDHPGIIQPVALEIILMIAALTQYLHVPKPIIVVA